MRRTLPDASTPTDSATAHTELHQEQRVVDRLYARLDYLRQATRERLQKVRKEGPSGSPQNRSERDAFATLYEDRLAQLESVEDRLVFGRLDTNDRSVMYIGRLGLTAEDHTPLLTDWRAPAAQSFYRATSVHPENLRRRRHLVTGNRVVTSVEDEVLDLSADVSDLGVMRGEGALLAALGAGRTGHMHDIVSTIQAEQDAVIRAPAAGALVVQGGPGTGKTAVALHRAAYLLYTHRRSLERSGVLLIGPSSTFLRYIDQVLPSLGETGVVTTTMAGLLPGIAATGTDTRLAAKIKGRPFMVNVLRRAVRARERVPAEPIPIRLDGRLVHVQPHDVAWAIARARRLHKPHNLARVSFVKDMLRRLADQYLTKLGGSSSFDDRASVVEDLRSHREVRIALNLAWMPLSPEGLLTDLYTKPWRLQEAAPELTPAECAALQRDRSAPWTPDDVPLLDELAEILGEDDQLLRAQTKAAAEQRTSELEYARQVLRTTGAGDLVSAEILADRFASAGPTLTTAERAANDRSWTYGHVIIDEAQELSPMGWRALLRRVPSRSLTIVGDVAQTSAPAGARSWAKALDPVLAGSWRMVELTVNYRTPATVADMATRFAVAAGLPVHDNVCARDVPDAMHMYRVSPAELAYEVAQLAQDTVKRIHDGVTGRVAVVGHSDHLDRIRELLPDYDCEPTSLESPLVLVTPTQVKGLEFDVVVLVEPARIVGSGSPSDLYVALTRPTKELIVVHAKDLPAGMRPQA